MSKELSYDFLMYGQLILVVAILEKEYFEKFIGKEVEVLIEEEKDNYYYGFTDNYSPIKIKGNFEINEIYKIKLKKEDINFMMN